MSVTSDPFLAMLSEAAPRKRKPDYSLGLAPNKHIEDSKRKEAEREYQRELLRSWRIGPASPPDAHSPTLPKKAETERPDWADDIDRIVETYLAEGDIAWDTTAEQYRRPHYRRWRFGAAD